MLKVASPLASSIAQENMSEAVSHAVREHHRGSACGKGREGEAESGRAEGAV
jgi:hypothetical protein